MSRIVVIGSSNTDMVVRTSRFPGPGETILGGEFFMFPGGKGANQAVAAARLGGRVTLVANVGDDLFGRQALAGFREEGIDTSYVLTDVRHASGVALITVDETGENTIVVAPGANAALGPADALRAAPAIAAAAVVLMQLETPLDTIVAVAREARAQGKKVVLNPAPARVLPDELYPLLYCLTPNETEAGLLTGIDVHDEAGAAAAARALTARGVPFVIVTLGARGALFCDGRNELLVPPPRVTPVDTTAAGDVFNGALAVALAEELNWEGALQLACRAAAVSVTRMGAQTSAPRRAELE